MGVTIPCGNWIEEPKQTHRRCRDERLCDNCAALRGLLAACETARVHVDELRDAWQRGSLRSTDGQDALRSNRNVDVDVALRKAIAAARPAGHRGEE